GADEVGIAEEPERLAGGRAIDDQDIEAALARVPEDLQQAEELLQAGKDDQLLAVDVGDVGPAEDAGQPALHGAPAALGLAQAVHLLPPEVVGHLYRIGAERPVQRVRQAVGRVGAEGQRPPALGGQPHRRGSRHARFAHPALARVHQHAHEPLPQLLRSRSIGAKKNYSSMGILRKAVLGDASWRGTWKAAHTLATRARNWACSSSVSAPATRRMSPSICSRNLPAAVAPFLVSRTTTTRR